jgi:hypothetical protein
MYLKIHFMRGVGWFLNILESGCGFIGFCLVTISAFLCLKSFIL